MKGKKNKITAVLNANKVVSLCFGLVSIVDFVFLQGNLGKCSVGHL